MPGNALLGVLWTAVILGAVSILVQTVFSFKVWQNIVKTEECVYKIVDLGASLMNAIQTILAEDRRRLTSVIRSTTTIAASAREITTTITELVRYTRYRFTTSGLVPRIRRMAILFDGNDKRRFNHTLASANRESTTINNRRKGSES